MFEIGMNDLLHLKGQGQPFAEFVDRLIRAEAFNSGVTQDNICGQLRAHIKDGGVDTEVRCQISCNSGWFPEPTFWQYKSVDGVDIKKNELEAEVRKPYAEKLIRDGFAMRFCILGDLPPEKVAAWEAQLLAEAQKVDPNAKVPRVIHGEHLRAWGETFPAVVKQLGRTQILVPCRDWKTWSEERRSLTKTYVPNQKWAGIEESIRRHVDFSTPANSPVFLLGGEAGVGKSRLAFETLDKCDGVSNLCVVTMDGNAAQWLATEIVSSPQKRAVLVADECTEDDRYLLNEIAAAATGRLRIIAISNTANRKAMETGQPWMKQDDLSNIDEILAKNRPEIPATARHNYAALSKGFVRLAIAMCEDHSRIEAGGLRDAMGSINEYVSRRVAGQAQEVASAIAIFHHVGFREDAATDLATLAAFTGISEQTFKKVVGEIRETPGFVVQAGRYWYVTPEIVTRILFAIGWKRWVEPDIKLFLGSLSEELFKSFQDQARKMAGKEEGEQLASFFREWLNRLTLESLIDPINIQILETLVESSAEQQLPLLTNLIVNASDDDLAELDKSTNYGTTPRRKIVWLLERLVVFADLFDDCEACLFRLAQHETEERIGNNATGIWKSLFSIYLSGTEATFEHRIDKLQSYMASGDERTVDLAYSALYHSTGKNVGRPLPPAAIAGRLRPQDWRPRSNVELLGCYKRVFAALDAQLVLSSHHRDLAVRYVAKCFQYYYRKGLLDLVIDFTKTANLVREEQVQFLHAAETCLGYAERSNQPAGAELEKLRTWAEVLRPNDFSGRLRDVCSRNFWDARFTDKDGKGTDEIASLVTAIMPNPELLTNELEWLNSPEALSAERLGREIGRMDVAFRFSEILFRRAMNARNESMLAGYIRGIVTHKSKIPESVLELMTELETQQPLIAAQLLPVAGEKFDALTRLFGLIKKDAIPPAYLRPLTSFYGSRMLTIEEVKVVLPKLLATDVPDAFRVAIEFAWIKSVHLKKGQQHLFEDSDFRNLIFDALERGSEFIEAKDAFAWCEVTKELAEYDSPRSARILSNILLGKIHRGHHEASAALHELAPKYGDAVMQAFGDALTDKEHGWKLQVGEYREIVDQLPLEVVTSWVEEHGEEGAKLIARHLSAPYIDDEGEPVIPQATDYLLRRFPSPAVINAFCSGTFSGDVWSADGGEQFRIAADQARLFLKSDNTGIREWAKREIACKQSMAVREDREYAERAID